MKKKSEKKLNLGKIKIASLSKSDQQMVNGGMPKQTQPIKCETTGCYSSRCA
jgi:hypothetical protein